MIKLVDIKQAERLIQQGTMIIIDIRDPASFQKQHIPTAISMDNNKLNQFISQTPNNTPLLFVCYKGKSSKNAAEYVEQQGFSNCYSLEGGMEAWSEQHTE